MFLTVALNAMKRKLFKGDMYRGKYRFVTPVKLKEMNLLQAEYARTERVMKLLMNPYLTQEESHAQHESLKQKRRDKFLHVIECRRLKKLKRDNVYIENRLVHLTVADSWDV